MCEQPRVLGNWQGHRAKLISQAGTQKQDCCFLPRCYIYARVPAEEIYSPKGLREAGLSYPSKSSVSKISQLPTIPLTTGRLFSLVLGAA